MPIREDESACGVEDRYCFSKTQLLIDPHNLGFFRQQVVLLS